MSFDRYPAYEEPPGSVAPYPAHWQVKPLKFLVTLEGGVTPSKERLDYWGGDVPWASAKDLKVDRLCDTEDHLTQKALDEGAASLVPAGSILIVVRGMILAHSFPVAVAVRPVAINQDLKALNSRGFLRHEYLIWLLRGLAGQTIAEVDEAAHGTKVLRIPSWLSKRFPIPPDDEQLAISAFLDVETLKLDELIAEQQRLVKLLTEKRQAVISHAVTRGLNPDAPMKPSGIEWLGDVPAHWEVLPIKRDMEFVTSGSRGWAEHYSDEGALFIRIANLTRDGIDLELGDVQHVVVPVGSEGVRTRVRADDLLFSITAYLGSVAVVPADLEPAYVSQHVALVRLRGARLRPRWVAFCALSNAGKAWFEMGGYGGTKIQLSLDDVRDLVVPVPPRLEQDRITAYLQNELEQIRKLTAESQRAIALLEERRAALISAAVTGQIDVRGLAAVEVA